MKTHHIIIVFAIITQLYGCNGDNVKYVDANEFKNQYKNIDMQETMKSREYLGISGDKAYIKISEKNIVGNGWNNKIIAVDLDSLDKEFIDKLPNKKYKIKP